jgi:hypothetical protein
VTAEQFLFEGDGANCHKFSGCLWNCLTFFPGNVGDGVKNFSKKLIFSWFRRLWWKLTIEAIPSYRIGACMVFQTSNTEKYYVTLRNQVILGNKNNGGHYGQQKRPLPEFTSKLHFWIRIINAINCMEFDQFRSEPQGIWRLIETFSFKHLPSKMVQVTQLRRIICFCDVTNKGWMRCDVTCLTCWSFGNNRSTRDC